MQPSNKKLTMPTFSASAMAKSTKSTFAAAAVLLLAGLAIGASALQTSRAVDFSRAAGVALADQAAFVMDAPPDRKLERLAMGAGRGTLSTAMEGLAQSASSPLVATSLKEQAAQAYGAFSEFVRQQAVVMKPGAQVSSDQVNAIFASVAGARRAGNLLNATASQSSMPTMLALAALCCLLASAGAVALGMSRLIDEFRSRFSSAVQTFRTEERAAREVASQIHDIAETGRFRPVELESPLQGAQQASMVAAAVNKLIDPMVTAADQLARINGDANTGVLRLQSQLGDVMRGSDQGAEQVLAGAEAADAAVIECRNMANDSLSLVHLAQQIQERSGEALFNIQDCGTRVEAMRSSFSDASKKLKAVGEHGQALSMLTTDLGHVADKAEVLALNAQLLSEAEGDGTGAHAVIAKELQELGRSMREVTDKVGGIVSDAQAETRVAAEAVETSMAHLQQASSVATVSGAVLGVVAPMSEECIAAARSLERRASDQVDGVQGISAAAQKAGQTVQALRTMVTNVAQTARDVGRLVQETRNVLPTSEQA